MLSWQMTSITGRPDRPIDGWAVEARFPLRRQLLYGSTRQCFVFAALLYKDMVPSYSIYWHRSINQNHIVGLRSDEYLIPHYRKQMQLFSKYQNAIKQFSQLLLFQLALFLCLFVYLNCYIRFFCFKTILLRIIICKKKVLFSKYISVLCFITLRKIFC